MLNYMDIIKNIDLFKNVSIESINNALSHNNYLIKTYKKNSIIYFQNEKCNTLDIILSGTITVQRIDEKGNCLSINDFLAGDIIGGNLLFSHKNFYPMTILSKTNSKLLHLSKNFVLYLCQNDSMFLINFLQSLSDKTIILANKLNTMTFKSLRERILDFLTYESYSQNSNIIKLTMTKKELAEKLGVQRTSLSRELNKMKKDGLITFDTHTITINK